MDTLRLADLIAALSQMTDLGMGQPLDSATRSCLLATALARTMGTDEREASAIYYATLLQHIGCTAYAHETAALLEGDDIAFRAAGARVDDARRREVLGFILTGVAAGASPPARVRAVFNLMRAGPAFSDRLYRSNCEVAVRIARRLGMSESVQQALDAIYTRWDGRGTPAIRGGEIALAARFAQVAGRAILFHDIGGADAAITTIRQGAGTSLDPTIAAGFVEHGRALLADIDAGDPFAAVLDIEPEPREIAASHIDTIAHAFADAVDLKSPWLHGHSAGVATLAESTARQLGLPDHEVTDIRRAGYLHDLGRVGVPSGIWDKPGPLTAAERDQAHLHPYYTERILLRSRALAPIASLAGMHHERLDGSGYHRGVTGTAIPVGARVLAAADIYQAMTSSRPHRAAHAPDAAAAQLLDDASHGRLDPGIVTALLHVAGHPAPRRDRARPAGLTDRELQVLRLAARGLSNRQIGERLFISPKTADHHVQHIYAKIGVSTRAGAAIYAMEHDLLDALPAPKMG